MTNQIFLYYDTNTKSFSLVFVSSHSHLSKDSTSLISISASFNFHIKHDWQCSELYLISSQMTAYWNDLDNSLFHLLDY